MWGPCSIPSVHVCQLVIWLLEITSRFLVGTFSLGTKTTTHRQKNTKKTTTKNNNKPTTTTQQQQQLISVPTRMICLYIVVNLFIS